MAREKTEKRVQLSLEEKETAFKKSNGRCCHCGKPLSLSKATVEHFIPLSKGGKNIPINTVCLCLDCNQNKDNLVIKPEEYYYFLQPEYMKELNSLYDSYLTDTEWLTTKNYATEDCFTVKYPTCLKPMSRSPKKKNTLADAYLYATAKVRKAEYTDLDDIIKFTEKYHQKYNLDASHIKEIVKTTFQLGAIYLVYKQDILTAVLPIKVEKTFFKDSKTYYIPVINGTPCLYPTESNINLIGRVVSHILKDIAILNNKWLVTAIVAPQNDKNINSYWGKIASKCFNHDAWNQYYIFFTPLTNSTTIKADKVLEKTSNFLQKMLKLSNINNENVKKNIVANRSKGIKSTKNYKNKKRLIRENEYSDENFYDELI